MFLDFLKTTVMPHITYTSLYCVRSLQTKPEVIIKPLAVDKSHLKLEATENKMNKYSDIKR